MLYNSTASDVALCYIEMAKKREVTRDVIGAEKCFRHAVEKANQALADPEENKHPDIGFVVSYQYGSFLFRLRRYVDAYCTFREAKKHSTPDSALKEDLACTEDEIRSIILTCLSG